MMSCSPSISVNTAGSGIGCSLTPPVGSREERARSAVADCEDAASNTTGVFNARPVGFGAQEAHTQKEKRHTSQRSTYKRLATDVSLPLKKTDTLLLISSAASVYSFVIISIATTII
jgi:hypothetical protein